MQIKTPDSDLVNLLDTSKAKNRKPSEKTRTKGKKNKKTEKKSEKNKKSEKSEKKRRKKVRKKTQKVSIEKREIETSFLNQNYEQYKEQYKEHCKKIIMKIYCITQTQFDNIYSKSEQCKFFRNKKNINKLLNLIISKKYYALKKVFDSNLKPLHNLFEKYSNNKSKQHSKNEDNKVNILQHLSYCYSTTIIGGNNICINEQCSICLDNFEENQNFITCNNDNKIYHCFHKECLQKFILTAEQDNNYIQLKKNSEIDSYELTMKCPVCNSNFVKNEIQEICQPIKEEYIIKNMINMDYLEEESDHDDNISTGSEDIYHNDDHARKTKLFEFVTISILSITLYNVGVVEPITNVALSKKILIGIMSLGVSSGFVLTLTNYT